MRVLCVATMRNEGPYILDWLAHHKAAGITDFIIYSNDCQDGTDTILDLLHEAGILVHVPQSRKGNKSLQWEALRNSWKHPLRKEADWVTTLDADEYLNIHAPEHNLAGLVNSTPDETDAIVMPWRLFGHNRVVEFQDKPVTEQFTRAIPDNCSFPIASTFFKTLFRPRGPFGQMGVHRPSQKPEGRSWSPRFVDGSGNPLPQSFCDNAERISLYKISSGRSLVECNHYSIRSAAGFLIKSERGLPNRIGKEVGLAYWVERNFNTVTDTSISAMRPATLLELTTLQALPGIMAAHAASAEWHRAAFARIVHSPAGHRLLMQVLTAGGSTVLPLRLQQQLVAWYQEANGVAKKDPNISEVGR